MPPARKSARSSSPTRPAFKEPAALKRLHSSLDSAQKALTELRTHAGRSAGQSTRDLQKGVGTFVSNARRDAGKLTRALTRDFEEAQKSVAKTASQTRSKATASRRKRSSTTAKRTGRKAS